MHRPGYSRLFFATIALFVCCSLPDYRFEPQVEASCGDRVRNGTETDVDCGGKACPACVDLRGCKEDSDCLFGTCVDMICRPPHCSDGKLDEDETEEDCGGEACSRCGVHQHCVKASDCRSNVCKDGACFPTSCDDAQIDGTETDLNCGGDTCPACDVGARCEQSGDCATGFCPNNLCAPMVCGNALQDAGELGVDCGGICPIPCDAAANCSNKRTTEAETDVDCGGGACARCADGKKCKVNADCTSNACTNFVCTPPCAGSQCDGGGGAGGAGNGAGGDDGQGGAPESGGSSHGGTSAGGAPASGGTLGSGGTLASGGVLTNGGSGQGGTGAGGTSGGAAQGGTGTGGTGTGGSGGTATGGATTFPEPTCSGCARLSVPLGSASDKANFVIFLPNNVNFSSAVMTMRVYRQAGSGGQFKGYVQHSGSPDYAQLFQNNAAELSSLTGWQDVVWNIGAHQTSFDKSNVARVGVQITAGGATTLTNPTVVYLDSITLSNAGAGPWNFDNGSSVSTSPAVSASSNVMFLNSGDSPTSNSGITWYSR